MAKKDAGAKWYIAPHDVYVDNLYTRAGVPFVTETAPGEKWVEVDAPEVPEAE